MNKLNRGMWNLRGWIAWCIGTDRLGECSPAIVAFLFWRYRQQPIMSFICSSITRTEWLSVHLVCSAAYANLCLLFTSFSWWSVLIIISPQVTNRYQLFTLCVRLYLLVTPDRFLFNGLSCTRISIRRLRRYHHWQTEIVQVSHQTGNFVSPTSGLSLGFGPSDCFHSASD